MYFFFLGFLSGNFEFRYVLVFGFVGWSESIYKNGCYLMLGWIVERNIEVEYVIMIKKWKVKDKVVGWCVMECWFLLFEFFV